MQLKDMIPGNRYLVGDGGGYDLVTCIGPLVGKEFDDYFGGDSFHGIAIKVMIHDKKNGDYEDVFFEATGYEGGFYIEPR